MIVNPAYIFMGKKAPKEMPILLDGAVSAQYQLYNANFTSGKFVLNSGGSVTFTLDLTGYKQVIIAAESLSRYGATNLEFQFVVGGDPLTIESYPFRRNTPEEHTFQIPKEYRTKNAQMRLRDVSGGKEIVKIIATS